MGKVMVAHEKQAASSGGVGIDPQLAFIVGHYKSGSTWLINLLSLHPWVRGVGETSLFSFVCANPDLSACTRNLYTLGFWGRGGVHAFVRNRLADWAGPVRRYWKPVLDPKNRPTTRMDLSVLDQMNLKRELSRCESREEFCRTFFRHLAGALKPRSYLVEKNNNIFLVDFMKSTFPEAKLIAIYRDGRDVVVSEKYFLKNEAGRTQCFGDSVRNWRKAMEAQFQYAEQYGIFAVSYEEMLADGRSVARRLLEYLELPAGDEVVDEMVRRSSFQFITGRKSGHERQNSFYRKGTAGDWVNHFTEADKSVFKEIAGDILIRLGYEQDFNW